MATATAPPEGKQDVVVSKKKRERQRPTWGLSPFEAMDRWFESFFPQGFMRPMRWEHPAWSRLSVPFEGKVPNVDIVDRDNEVLVRVEIPGVEKEDLDVSVTDNTVTIKGTASFEEKEEKGDYYRCEISRGAFTRTVALPGEVDADKAKATFKNGMLEMTLPKLEVSKRHSIRVD